MQVWAWKGKQRTDAKDYKDSGLVIVLEKDKQGVQVKAREVREGVSKGKWIEQGSAWKVPIAFECKYMAMKFSYDTQKDMER